MQAAVSSLLEAVGTDGESPVRKLPVVPQGANGGGSTVHVDFHSTKPVYPVEKCHLNAMVADTARWEQSAAFALDAHPGVVRWVKNDHLGFVIPYRKRNILARYIPDFIVVLDSGLQLIAEIKGQFDDDADMKDRDGLAEPLSAQALIRASTNSAPSCESARLVRVQGTATALALAVPWTCVVGGKAPALTRIDPPLLTETDPPKH
jgi:hypothetical protein